MDILLSAESSEPFLLKEIEGAWPGAHSAVQGPALVQMETPSGPGSGSYLAFCRQFLPEAAAVTASSISAWSEVLLNGLVDALDEDRPWQLHVEPHYGSEQDSAGRNRCRLIVEAFREKLQRKRRRLLRSCLTGPGVFTEIHSLVQLLLTSPATGYLSLAKAPRPFQLRALMSPFPKGEIPVATDKAAPSRAFAKLIEAELRLGARIERGQTCVDLGAAPGSWSYVALNRGARVIAVDRAPLRDDLMRHPGLEFRQGDAFKYIPDQAVDWLVCDVIAAPDRSIALVNDWVRHQRARRFVVTIKFKGHDDYPMLEELKQSLPAVCEELYLNRLCANKNEVCAFGSVRR